jgi:hypothetical protein
MLRKEGVVDRARIATATLVAVFLAGAGIAAQEDSRQEACGDRHFANSLSLKLTYVEVGSRSDVVQEADAYAVWKDRVGFGIDTAVARGSFFEVKPYFTLSGGKLPLSLLLSYDANSGGARHAGYGGWYAPTVGRLHPLLEAVNYTALSREGRDYLDVVVAVNTPVGKTGFAGLEAEGTHRWNREADAFFVGPTLHSKVGSLTLTTKILYERHFVRGATLDGYSAFLALKIPFQAL